MFAADGCGPGAPAFSSPLATLARSWLCTRRIVLLTHSSLKRLTSAIASNLTLMQTHGVAAREATVVRLTGVTTTREEKTANRDIGQDIVGSAFLLSLTNP